VGKNELTCSDQKTIVFDAASESIGNDSFRQAVCKTPPERAHNLTEHQ